VRDDVGDESAGVAIAEPGHEDLGMARPNKPIEEAKLGSRRSGSPITFSTAIPHRRIVSATRRRSWWSQAISCG